MFEHIIQLIKILASVASIGIGAWTIVRVFGKDRLFEDAQDRDGTIIMLLIFATFWGLMWMFRASLKGEIISGIIIGLVGSISMMVAFFYKRNGDKS